MYNEKMNEQYNKFVEGWSLRLIDRYSIIPSRNDEIDFELSDFELIKYREDICKRSGLEPYFFIADDIRENYMTGDDIVFGLRVTPSQLNMLVNDVAKRVYEMCRSDIAQEDRFEREINNVVNKYFEKYKMDTLDEMYEKKDLRHTFCTRLAEINFPLKVAQNIMGHADAETTLNIYTAVEKRYKKNTVKEFDGKIYLGSTNNE